MGRIRSELFTLPIPVEQDAETMTRADISAGETLADMAGYWGEAAPEERRDMVGGLLMIEGLIYDLERRAVAGVLPRPNQPPALAPGVEKEPARVQPGSELCLCSAYPSPNRDTD